MLKNHAAKMSVLALFVAGMASFGVFEAAQGSASPSSSGVCFPVILKSTASLGCRAAPSGYVERARGLGEMNIPVPAQPTAPALPAINDLTPPPFSSSDYLTNNSWSGTVAGVATTIFAGSVGGDSSEGVLVIETVGDNGSTTLTPIASPSANGALTIDSVDSGVLTLSSNGGGIAHFDLASDTFTQ